MAQRVDSLIAASIAAVRLNLNNYSSLIASLNSSLQVSS